MTKEQKTISYKNRKKAFNYFIFTGEIPWDAEPYAYVLHHRDESLRHEDIERYIQWNIEDLEVMKKSDHSSMHAKQNNFGQSTRFKKGNKPHTNAGKHRVYREDGTFYYE